MRRASAFQWLFIPAICVLQLLIAGSLSYLFYPPSAVSQTLIDQAAYWLIWAVLSPLLLILSRRFPLERPGLLINLPLHVAAGVICGTLVQGLYLLLLLIVQNLTGSLISEFKRPTYILILSIFPNIMGYWVILAINLIFHYYQRYQNELLKAAKLDAQLSNARLQALKMQLHPHFLFNTLHSITALVLKNENRDAVKMINRLSEFLRLTLETAERQAVTLREELEFTRRYLEIELIRFADRLSVKVNVDPPALDTEVPNLILQPLVENAMRHAVDFNLETSRIEIFACVQNGRVLLEVRDDGKDSKKVCGQNGAPGLGLKNTRARLAEFYGENYSFSLSRKEDGWTVAQIVIPSSPIKEQLKGELH